jgi:hypothetical protein
MNTQTPSFRRRCAARFALALVAWLCLASMAAVVRADSVVLRIRAINKSPMEKQKVEVKAYLPKPATPADVLSAGDLETAYDVHSQAYYVHKEVELEPREVRTYEVTLRDIWVVPEAALTEAAGHAANLAEALKSLPQGESAGQLRATIEVSLKSLRDRQGAAAVTVAKPIDHIRAYESNVELLERIRKDLALLENLAIAAGKDPEKIIGAAATPAPDRTEELTGVTNTLIIRIEVRNPSLTSVQTNTIRRDLPVEIKPPDIVDAGGMNIGYDTGRGVCYAYLDNPDVPPQQTRQFEIKVRNPWAAGGRRILALEARATNLLARAKGSEAYKSVVDSAQGLLKELGAVREQKAPDVLNEEYVAFFRQQAAQLSRIESQVLRIEELFQPREKPFRFENVLPEVPRPSRKTTWVIIYIVLIFLGVVSLLFFLRWYGRSKSEQLARLSDLEPGADERRAAREPGESSPK